MAEHTKIFLLLTILALVMLTFIFGMKYFVAGRQARLRLVSEGAYRELAETSAAALSASAASLAAVQTDLAEMKARLSVIEKVLREVG
ncbi:MAG TPA: hypothetical protein VKS24_22510 [Bradyrhizobium sp.]|nr:hypothetical protein [Bradyrhizobium sp.]